MKDLNLEKSLAMNDHFYFNGKIHILKNASQIIELCNLLKDQPVIGFDTESRPAFKKGQYFPISLMQIACKEEVFLIQTLQSGYPDCLFEFFENPTIIKLGISLYEDLRKIQKIFNFQIAFSGFTDLGVMAKERGFVKIGARNLCLELLEIKLSKKMQISNWAKKELSKEQMLYAATDAWICHPLHDKLQEIPLAERAIQANNSDPDDFA